MLCDTCDTEGPHGRGGDCGWLAKKGGMFHGGGDLKGSLNSRWLGWVEDHGGTAGWTCVVKGDRAWFRDHWAGGSVRGCRGRPLRMVTGLEAWGDLSWFRGFPPLLFLSLKIKNILHFIAKLVLWNISFIWNSPFPSDSGWRSGLGGFLAKDLGCCQDPNWWTCSVCKAVSERSITWRYR